MSLESIVAQHLRITIAIRGLAAVVARGVDDCDAKVVQGRANNGSLTKENMRFEADAQDFLMFASEYKPGEVLTEPMADDTITLTMQGKSCVFEVRPFSDSEQCFARDATGVQLRIHTKLKSAT